MIPGVESKCLVVTCGYFGDIIFATSLAEKLKSEQGHVEVDYLIGFPQVARLVHNNPSIDRVFVSDSPSAHPISDQVDFTAYTRVVTLQPLHYLMPPAYEYQQSAGIQDPTPTYTVYTESEYDKIAESYIAGIRQADRKVIAVMSNWKSKTYLFTPDQYAAGIDVPNLGYGGSHRNIEAIIDKLKQIYTIVEVGVPAEYNQASTVSIEDDNQKSLLFEASLMKYCDAFVGTDGGLASIAAGVGTKTIITGDFNLQLYGWNGVIKKISHPRLGPYEYFGDPHVVLDPYLTDEQVIDQIISNI